jgi:hypothetical protein
MQHSLNLAKLPKGGFSQSRLEEIQQRFKEHQAKVRQEKMRGVEVPGGRPYIRKWPRM